MCHHARARGRLAVRLLAALHGATLLAATLGESAIVRDVLQTQIDDLHLHDTARTDPKHAAQ